MDLSGSLGSLPRSQFPVSYKVMLGDGNIVRRHVDQILASSEDKDLVEPEIMEPMEPWNQPLSESAAAAFAAPESSIPEGSCLVPEADTEGVARPVLEQAKPSVLDIQPPGTQMQSQSSTALVRRSSRPVSKPRYLKDYEC